MVVKADTVAYPGAVVIHSHHALAAKGAMMSPWWPKRLALLAVAPAYQHPGLLRKVRHNVVFKFVPICVRHIVNLLLQRCQFVHVNTRFFRDAQRDLLKSRTGHVD